jgi:hypothetical protein
MERAALILLFAALPAWGFDAGGVALGAAEADVLRHYPAARCRPLEWKSDAAERRCDDARAEIAGVQARVTYFLKGDAVQAFDVRFDAQHLERVAAFLKERFGKPVSETREKIESRRETRELYKLRWQQGRDQAVLTSQIKRRRVDLNVWRGDFDTEIYRIK